MATDVDHDELAVRQAFHEAGHVVMYARRGLGDLEARLDRNESEPWWRQAADPDVATCGLSRLLCGIAGDAAEELFAGWRELRSDAADSVDAFTSAETLAGEDGVFPLLASTWGRAYGMLADPATWSRVESVAWELLLRLADPPVSPTHGAPLD